MSLVKLIEIKSLGDERGQLISLEANVTIPFEIKRVYCIFGSKNDASRGFHAHRNLQQLLVCVTGSCNIILDDGTNREEVWLDTPNKGLIVNNLIWREMHNFSHDCVLLVLASNYYDEADYIRDYQEFLKDISR